MIFPLMLLGGIVLGAWNIWQRLGRSRAARSWTRSLNPSDTERNVLVSWPLLALGLVLGSLAGLAGDGSSVRVASGLLFLATLLLWFLYTVFPLPVPRAVQPRWYRWIRDPEKKGG